MSSTRRPWWVLVVLLVAIAVGLGWCARPAPPGTSPSAAAPSATTAAGPVSGAAAPVAPAAGVGGPPSRADARARRDALREQILRQLAQRQVANGGNPPAAGHGTASDSAPPGDGLRNKMDERHQPVVDQLNRDFMPLAKECVEQAQQRTPQLTGMIALSLETVADDQVGAVVDIADPAPSNQVADPALFECLRESAFSLSLPPPPTGGRMKALITLKVDDSDSGSGSGHS